MVETLLTFWLVIALLLLPLFVCWRILSGRWRMSHLATLLLAEFIMGVWHVIFGPKRVQVGKRGRKRWRRRN